MENHGLISVIIPVYNVEKYLKQCLDSVLAQTYSNYEVILVDDGSMDRSSQICDDYAASDSRIRCIHKENGGASTARNTGLDAATGEFVFFLDSDDWLDAQALEKLLSSIEKSEIDFSFCEAYAVDEETGEISCKNYTYHRNYGIDSAQTIFSEMVSKKEFHVAVWMILYRREFLLRSTLRFVEKIMYEDCVFAYQVYKQANIAAHVHEYLYHRRYRKNSVMTSKKTVHNFISAKSAYEEVLSLWKSFGEDDKDKPYVSRIAYNAINNYRVLSSTDKRKYAADFAKIKRSILENGAFSDKGLHAACYGKPIWLLYKIADKIIHFQ